MAGAAPSTIYQFRERNFRFSFRIIIIECPAAKGARTHGYGGTYAEYYIRCN